MGSKTQFVNAVNHFTQIVTALDAVFQFAKNLANLVFNGICILGRQFKFFQVGEKFTVYKVGKRSSPVRALWSIFPSANFGAAQMLHWYSWSIMGV
jgi:hypothetical protein